MESSATDAVAGQVFAPILRVGRSMKPGANREIWAKASAGL
jgi:hypothetical protein